METYFEVPELFTSSVAAPLVFVASTGGHLAQLVRFSNMYGHHPDSVWVTFKSPQSESLLKGKNVIYTDYIKPRDLSGVIRAYKLLERSVNPSDFKGVVSTGAALALAGFLWARHNKLKATYIESVSRTNGPSLTGRLVRTFNLAETYCQHSRWSDKKWRLTQSVMHSYLNQNTNKLYSESKLRIFVTLGTIKPYRFDSLVDRVSTIVTQSDEVVWQLGETIVSDLPGKSFTMLDSEQFDYQVRSADVVITHAGVGTILQLLDEGVCPVVVPRRAFRAEHVDDHQLQIWTLLKEAGIGVPSEVDQLTRKQLIQAGNSATIRN